MHPVTEGVLLLARTYAGIVLEYPRVCRRCGRLSCWFINRQAITYCASCQPIEEEEAR